MTRAPRALAAGAVTLTAVLALVGCAEPAQWWGPQAAAPSSTGPTSRPVSPSPSTTPSAAVTPTPSPSSSPTPTPSSTPSPTQSPSASPTPTATRTTLSYGDSGPRVLALQQRLASLGYWLGTPDGDFGPLTQQAVFAIQKAAGISRDGVVGPITTRALENGVRPTATLSGDGIEIDIARQLLLIVRGGSVVTILNTSTGSGEHYISTFGTDAIATTPTGTFRALRAVDGMATSSLGTLWRPVFYMANGIAVHGSPSIPPYPASHGCVRVSYAAMNMIWARDLMPIGSIVKVR